MNIDQMRDAVVQAEIDHILSLSGKWDGNVWMPN